MKEVVRSADDLRDEDVLTLTMTYEAGSMMFRALGVPVLERYDSVVDLAVAAGAVTRPEPDPVEVDRLAKVMRSQRLMEPLVLMMPWVALTVSVFTLYLVVKG